MWPVTGFVFVFVFVFVLQILKQIGAAVVWPVTGSAALVSLVSANESEGSDAANARQTSRNEHDCIVALLLSATGDASFSQISKFIDL